jgi:3-hydroxyacyl-CoA dehydrogenase
MYEKTRDPIFNPPVMLQKMISAGWFGRKTGRVSTNIHDPRGPVRPGFSSEVRNMGDKDVVIVMGVRTPFSHTVRRE